MPLSHDAATRSTGLPIRDFVAIADVPCVYCHSAISSATFDFASPSRQLVRAPCPACGRTVTMLAATWRRESARTLRLRD
jgi:hypothetical protein